MQPKNKKNIDVTENYRRLTKKEREKVIADTGKRNERSSESLDFERAAELRDIVFEFKAEGCE